MRRMLHEFKQFAVKGNAIDLAVGVIIGGAFGKIVNSVVSDLIMPFVSWIMGKGIDFSGLFLILGHVPSGTPETLESLRSAQVPVFAYGSFLTILVNFIILAFIIFIMVRQINRLRDTLPPEEPEEPEEPKPTPEDILLLREIRDNLQRQEK